MPLARRRCPHCFHENPLSDDTRSLEVLFLQEKLAGKFEIISEIHRHANSTLFLAQDLILDRKIALKSLKFEENAPDALIERWNQNLKRCLRLDEQHLARIYTYGSIGFLHYIILEFVDCETLESVIGVQPDGLPVWKCLRIGRDIAQGLHAAHNMGIVHHRLTPSNVAVSRDGFSRLLDLGAAQGTIDALAQHPWSPVMDSSLYFAPEQIESGISEPQSDQYRLAAILYHALTGKPAFEDSGEIGAFQRLQQDPPPPDRWKASLPEELSSIILKAMSRNPDERFRDCGEFAIQLESLEPDLWLPDIESDYRASTSEATVALLLADVHRNEQDRNYYRALVLCEQALTLAPYSTEVTNSLLRLQKLYEKEQHLRSIVNKALVAFYADNLNESLSVLQNGRQIDRDNPEILRLTHEVMQEQERIRLIGVLLDAARIDLAKQSFSSAMSNVVRILDIDSRNETALKLKQRIEIGMEDRAALSTLLNQALSAYEGDNLEEAEVFLQKILAIDPENFSAKKLQTKISQQKKHHLLMSLWENLDREFRCGQYRKAMDILRQISDIEPALKQDIRDRLVRIRQKIAEQNNMTDSGDTQPLRVVKSSDLSGSQDSLKSPAESMDKAVLPVEEDSGQKTEPEKPESSSTIPVSSHSTLSEMESSLEETPSIINEWHTFETPPAGTRVTDQQDATLPEPGRIESGTANELNLHGESHVESSPDNGSLHDQPSEEVKTGPAKAPPAGRSFRLPFQAIVPWAVAILLFSFLAVKFIWNRSDTVVVSDTETIRPPPEITVTPSITAENSVDTGKQMRSEPSPAAKPVIKKDEPIRTPKVQAPKTTTSEMVLSILSSAHNNEKLGNIDTALTLYHSVLKRDPKNEEAKAGIERCNKKLHRPSSDTPRRTTLPAGTSTATPAAAIPKPTPAEVPLPVASTALLDSVTCSPPVPVKGKNLRVKIEFKSIPGPTVKQVWLNYKKQANSLGYSQVFAERKGQVFEVTIPGGDIRGTAILYYLNGFDETGGEFFIGSPTEPKILP